MVFQIIARTAIYSAAGHKNIIRQYVMMHTTIRTALYTYFFQHCSKDNTQYLGPLCFRTVSSSSIKKKRPQYSGTESAVVLLRKDKELPTVLDRTKSTVLRHWTEKKEVD